LTFCELDDIIFSATEVSSKLIKFLCCVHRKGRQH